jgi:glycosyltransferase involved in cell wall biosynthesis
MNKRLVYLTDADPIGSGYLNLSIPLLSGLTKLGYEIKVLGIGYKGTQHNYPFSIIPTANLQEVFAMLQNLWTTWQFDCFVVALDIPLQCFLLSKMRNRPFKYVGIMPVEADPLCMSWAAQITQMDKAMIISKFGFEEAKKAGVFIAAYLQVGVDTDLWRIPIAEERNKIRTSILGFDEDTFAVLTVADNQERKNLACSMQIFSEFAKDKPNARYILITRKNSPVGWNLDDLAIDLGIQSKMLYFERGMDFKQLWSIYAASDCMLLTSKTEGTGLPILEAMSIKLPCIATYCTGLKESLEDGRGYLIDYEYQHIDCFGNGNRYWASKKHGLELLEKVYAKQLPDIQSARKYVEDRKWSISVNQLDEALKEVIGEQK